VGCAKPLVEETSGLVHWGLTNPPPPPPRPALLATCEPHTCTAASHASTGPRASTAGSTRPQAQARCSGGPSPLLLFRPYQGRSMSTYTRPLQWCRVSYSLRPRKPAGIHMESAPEHLPVETSCKPGRLPSRLHACSRPSRTTTSASYLPLCHPSRRPPSNGQTGARQKGSPQYHTHTSARLSSQIADP
jgi:hypothetical protein